MQGEWFKQLFGTCWQDPTQETTWASARCAARVANPFLSVVGPWGDFVDGMSHNKAPIVPGHACKCNNTLLPTLGGMLETCYVCSTRNLPITRHIDLTYYDVLCLQYKATLCVCAQFSVLMFFSWQSVVSVGKEIVAPSLAHFSGCKLFSKPWSDRCCFASHLRNICLLHEL